MNTGEITRGGRAVERSGREAQSSDFAGLVPFGAGVFLAVLVAQARFRPPEGEPRGTAALAATIEGAVGAAPALWVALGCAFLGGRWFLRGRPAGFFRHLGGIAGLALGLAFVAGAFSDSAGGSLGAAPRTLLGSTAGALMGALLGLAIAGGTAWSAWLRGSTAISWRKWKTLTGETPRGSARTRNTPRAGGVTEEEAEALLPPAPAAREDDEADAELDLDLDLEPDELEAPEELVGSAPVASPYPEDVRRKGEIPPGARPLGPPPERSDDFRSPAPAEPHGADDPRPLYRWTPQPPAAAGDAAGRDLAGAEPGGGADATEARGAGAPRPEPDPGVRPLTPEGVEARAIAPPAPLRPRPGTPPQGVQPVVRSSSPPRPSWESGGFVQEELFEGGAPADAEDPEASVHPGDEAVAAAVELEEEAIEATDEVAEADETEAFEDEDALAAALVEEAEDLEVAEDEESELEPELVEEMGYDDADEEDDEDSDDDDDEEDEAEDDDDYDDDDDEEEKSDDDEDGYEYDDGEEEDELVEPSPDDELEPAPLPAVAASADPLADAAELEDTSELDRELDELLGRDPARAAAPGAEAPPAAEPDLEPAADEDTEPETEPEVVLQPAAAPARAGRPSEIVVEAGCLFVERDRVAVSMLQRQFGLDFEACCAVLDELQERGLIGPYLGGKTREILMSREEWLEAAGA